MKLHSRIESSRSVTFQAFQSIWASHQEAERRTFHLFSDDNFPFPRDVFTFDRSQPLGHLKMCGYKALLAVIDYSGSHHQDIGYWILYYTLKLFVFHSRKASSIFNKTVDGYFGKTSWGMRNENILISCSCIFYRNAMYPN